MRRLRARDLLWPLALWLCLLTGVTLLCVAYAYAARHDTEVKFHLFWAGLLVFYLPAGVRLAMASTPRLERAGVLAVLGLFSYLPKYLRDPSFPLFHDEFAHWRQTEDIHDKGHLFVDNTVISLIRDFPGLHGTTDAIRELTGLSTFAAGSVLLAAGHVALLVAVFVIVERLSGSDRAGAIAALIYAASPGFMFFHSQFAYESLAILLVVWLVAALVLAETERRRGWLWPALLLGAACVPTHHVSSWIAAVLVAVAAALAMVRARQGDEGAHPLVVPLWVLAVALGAAAAAWAIWVAPDVGGYVSGPLNGGLTDVRGLLSPKGTTRAPFGGSEAPFYERASAFVAVLIAFASGLGGVWLLRRRRAWRGPGLALALGALGFLYFPSLVFNLTARGSESAHRSWAFSYLGLAVLIAPFVVVALTETGRRARLVAVGAVAALAIVLVGNVATDVNVFYRFPGRFVYGSDTRSATPELLAAADTFRRQYGPGVGVVADRYVALGYVSKGKARTALNSPGFPIWQLFYRPGHPDPSLLEQLRASGFRFMVVDTRMPELKPFVGGVEFELNEPITGKLPPKDMFTTFSKLPWTPKVFASDHLVVYRLDLDARSLPAPPVVAPR